MLPMLDKPIAEAIDQLYPGLDLSGEDVRSAAWSFFLYHYADRIRMKLFMQSGAPLENCDEAADIWTKLTESYVGLKKEENLSQQAAAKIKSLINKIIADTDDPKQLDMTIFKIWMSLLGIVYGLDKPIWLITQHYVAITAIEELAVGIATIQLREI